MILSEETKQKIKDDYNNWFDQQYGKLSKSERDALGAVYTPAEVTIKMIESFDSIENKTILDPCCGSGNLLVGCILAGANPDLIYGNEYNKDMVDLCRKRVSKFGVPEWHIHQGDATDPKSFNFDENYKLTNTVKKRLW